MFYPIVAEKWEMLNVFAGVSVKKSISAPDADILRSSRNAHLRRECGGDSGDNPERKSGRFLKTSGSGLHRQMDIRTSELSIMTFPKF